MTTETAKLRIIEDMIKNHNASSQIVLDSILETKKSCDKQCDMVLEQQLKHSDMIIEQHLDSQNKMLETYAKFLSGVKVV